MASHHHSCCRWLVASVCPCQPPFVQVVGGIFVVPAHLVESDIIFRTQTPQALCLMVGPNSQVVCELDELAVVIEDVSDQFDTCDECCAPPPPPPQPCPSADECVTCPLTISMEAVGFGFTICFLEGDLVNCPNNCVEIGPLNISRVAEKTSICRWDIPGPNFDIFDNCHVRHSIQFWPSAAEIACIGHHWRITVRVAFGLLPPAIAFIDFLYETPNVNHCPFGEYSLSNIDINVSSAWEVTSTTAGTVVIS